MCVSSGLDTCTLGVPEASNQRIGEGSSQRARCSSPDGGEASRRGAQPFGVDLLLVIMHLLAAVGGVVIGWSLRTQTVNGCELP